MKKGLVFTALLGGLLVFACRKNEPDNQSQFPGFIRPDHFPAPEYHFDTNPITEAGFELGRRLFYEPRLSSNNMLSCGSCHIQASAFSHHGHDVSHGVEDRLGKRNAPALSNLAWYTSFNWDGGVFDLDLQPIVPITAHEEMDESIDNVLSKLRAHPEYPNLFEKAFGTSEITANRMFKALSQFMLMCISADTKYDRVMLGKASFSAEEQAGYVVFKEKCASCHQEPLFTDMSFRNNGIGIGSNNDSGRYLVTLHEEDLYRFRVPSLRNWKYSAPYMHDGRYATLEQVLNRYEEPKAWMQNIDPVFEQADGTYRIILSESERANLISFLNTLNDDNYVRNPLFSE